MQILLVYTNSRNEIERCLANDTLISDERKLYHLHIVGRTESSYLRLRRTRLGLDDFRTVKVIGKGAFGEVCRYFDFLLLSYEFLHWT